MITDIRNERSVAAAVDAERVGYPPLAAGPFHPSEPYPEFETLPVGAALNPAYRLLRQALLDLGLDVGRFNTAGWNPLGELVPPGARIVIKPNWVMHRNEGPGGFECLVTHPALLRAVTDYALLAGPSQVIIGDAPLQLCNWRLLLHQGLQAVLDYYRAAGAPVHAADFRRTTLERRGHELIVQENLRPLDQYQLVELGDRSLLEPVSDDSRRFRVTLYDPRRMRKSHQPGRHRYLVAREVLDADLVINVPKLKTHKKAGITGALKNLVGINGSKDFLPHHRKGPVTGGGDAYARFNPLKWAAEEASDLANRNLRRPWLNRPLNRLVYALLVMDKKLGGNGEAEGGWHGNDTVWRMCLDLNRLLLYADARGRMRDTLQRVELTIMDALVAGEGEGPLRADPRPLHLLLAALNPAAADWVAARLMGFDPERIPIVREAFRLREWPLTFFRPDDIECRLAGAEIALVELAARHGAVFKPAAGWAGQIELRTESR